VGKESIRCAGLMTAGRYENTRARNVIDTAFRKAGIPLSVSLGVYYHQCMQNMMLDTLELDVDFIVTVDGDSFITSDQILLLLKEMVADPTLDAIAAMQAKRGESSMLAGCDGAKTVTVGIEPIRVDAAHFGLTAISAEALRRAPLPLFLPVPNEEGRWDDGRVDADIYFWKNWKKAGNTLAVHPHVRIGHMEEMVSMYDANFKLHHVYPNEWEPA
jgi:hypothetical protein